MATSTDTLIFELKVDDQASKVFDSWDKKLKDVGETFASTFSDAVLAAPLVALEAIWDIFKKIGEATSDLFIDTVKEAANFEDALIVARRTIGLTAEDAQILGKALLDLSTELGGISADTLAEVAGQAGTLGLEGVDNIVEFSEAIAKIAIDTDLSAAVAAEKIPKILTIFGVAADEMGEKTKELGNQINVLGNDMNTTQSQILKVVDAIAGSAKEMGMTQEEMIAVSAAIATVSTQFGTAGGSFSQIISKMTADYTTFAEVLGIQSEQLKYAIENDPVEALRMVVEALGEIKETEGIIAAQQSLNDLGLSGYKAGEFMKKMTAIFGEIDFALEKLSDTEAVKNSLDQEMITAMDTLTMAWGSFMNILDNVQKFLGTTVINVFKELLQDYVIPLAQEFYAWVTQSEGVQAVLNDLLFIGKNVFETLFKKATEFIQGVDFEAFFLKIHNALWDFNDALEEVDWGQLFSGLKEDFKEIVEAIKTAVSDFAEFAKSFAVFILDVNKVVGVFESIGGFVSDTVEGWGMINDAIQSLFKPLADLVVWLETWSFSSDETTQKVVGFWEQIFDAVSEVWEALKETGEFVVVVISSMMDLGNVVLNLFTGLGEVFRDTDKAMATFVGAIDLAIGAFKKLGDIAYGNSVLVDIIEWTGKAGTTIDSMGNSVDKVGGSFDEIYTRGEFTFSNLRTEVTDCDTVFQRSAEKVQAWNGETTYSFEQMASTISGVAAETTDLTERNLLLAESQQMINDAYAESIELATGATDYVNEIMATTDAALAAGAALAEGVTLSGFGEAIETAINPYSSAESLTSTSSSTDSSSTSSEPINITVELGGEEIAVITDAVNDQNDQNDRRSS